MKLFEYFFEALDDKYLIRKIFLFWGKKNICLVILHASTIQNKPADVARYTEKNSDTPGVRAVKRMVGNYIVHN